IPVFPVVIRFARPLTNNGGSTLGVYPKTIPSVLTTGGRNDHSQDWMGRASPKRSVRESMPSFFSSCLLQISDRCGRLSLLEKF
ncbi:MAG TPA: hypothetical protein PLD05_15645, partial [Thermogutta sp.]|nr:hypothetical protein [Thermogutta sp.]